MDRKISPTVYDFGRLSLPSPSCVTLPCGITLHYESGGEIEVNRITVALPGGEVESTLPDLASAALSLLSEGTETHSGEEIAAILEYNGAWLTSGASIHHSTLTLSSLNDNFLSLLSILKELIISPSFPEDTCRQVLDSLASRIELEREKVAYLADEAIRKLAYGHSNPLARNHCPDTIRAFTPKQLSDFHFSRLDPAEIHIFLSGKLSSDMIDAVIGTFSDFPTLGTQCFTPLVFPENYDREKRSHISRPYSKQSAVKIMIPSVGRDHPDFIPLRAAVSALGGYFGSRLMLNIREDKGLTYGISAGLYGYKTRSFISISTQTDASTVDEVISLTEVELDKIKDPASFNLEELKRLQGHLFSNLATTLDTPFTRMDFHQACLFVGNPPDYFERLESFARNITAERLSEIASRYFDTSRLLLATAGS